MAIQYADTILAARTNALVTAIGASPVLRIYNGTEPADESTALSGNTELVAITLPSTWAAVSSAGVLTLNGSWGPTNATAAGTATFFRLENASTATTRIQGSVAASSSDLNLNNTNIASGQAVSVTSFQITPANA